MENLKGACIIGQSGGPTAVINASAQGVIQTALASDQITRVLGAAHGIKGVLADQFYDMSQEDPAQLDLLQFTPSSALGSCRYKLADPDVDDTDYRRILEIFKKYDVRYFFYNGGNDSMDTCNKISKYMQRVGYPCNIIGVPKTIDNDLDGTDHCPGYASAAKYIATSCMELYQDARVYDTGTVVIVEIMGRHAGWLTAAAALSRKFEGDNPILIYLPEVAFDQEDFIRRIEKAFETKNSLIVCVSEGIHDAEGKFICEYTGSAGTDPFGHKMLTGCGKYLENFVRERLGIKVRSVELNLCQRCSIFSQSLTDAREAALAGSSAVEAALKGESGKMVSFVRTSDEPYELTCSLEDVNSICNQEKKVPLEWITKDGTDVSEEFLTYARPLIQGNPAIPMKNGLPDYAYRR